VKEIKKAECRMKKSLRELMWKSGNQEKEVLVVRTMTSVALLPDFLSSTFLRF